MVPSLSRPSRRFGRKTWTRAAQVRRQNLSTFVRNCTDAGAAVSFHQIPLQDLIAQEGS